MTLTMHPTTRLTTHRSRAALATTLILAAGLLSVPAATASPDRAAAGTGTRLTNLAHLDFLAAEVTPPAQTGFGTRLIERSLAAQLSAAVRMNYEPTGLVCTIDAPLAAIRDDEAV